MIEFFKGMFENISVALTLDAVTLLDLCILLGIFIIYAGFGGGEFIRIKRMFGKTVTMIKESDDKRHAAEAGMSLFPERIFKIYLKSVDAGNNPSEALTSEICVYAPHSETVLPSLSKVAIMAFSAIDALMLAYGVAVYGVDSDVWVGIAVITLAGVILSIIGAVISRLTFSSALKSYKVFIAALDGVFAAKPVHSSFPDFTEPAFADDYVEKKDVTVPLSEVEQTEPELNQIDYAETTSPQPVEDTAEQVPVSENFLDGMEDETDLYFPNTHETVYSATASEPDYEDVIVRIDRIGERGASVEEMREVAELLNAERLKPENRTPDRKRKLDEAFASLLKSVTKANKE